MRHIIYIYIRISYRKFNVRKEIISRIYCRHFIGRPRLQRVRGCVLGFSDVDTHTSYATRMVGWWYAKKFWNCY